MIGIFTDYGTAGPYLGSIYSILVQSVPNERVITLMADAPRHKPKMSAYLLPALASELPKGSIIFAVVDPGVGSEDHVPVILNLDGLWFVGPDNGIFDILARRSSRINCWQIPKPSQEISNTFHGRDLYAPACAVLARDGHPQGQEFSWEDRRHWPDELSEIIYIDHFGNAMTGIRGAGIDRAKTLKINDQLISYADYFAMVKPGQGFWHVNSYGLLELAVNLGNASELLGLRIGTKIAICG